MPAPFFRSFEHSNCAVLCSRPLPLISRPNLLQVQHQEALERAREVTFANKSWHHMFQDASSFLMFSSNLFRIFIFDETRKRTREKLMSEHVRQFVEKVSLQSGPLAVHENLEKSLSKTCRASLIEIIQKSSTTEGHKEM